MTNLIAVLVLLVALLLQGCGDNNKQTSSGGGTKFCLNCSGLSGAAELQCKIQNANLGCNN